MGILKNKIRKLTEELNKKCLIENLSRGLLKYQFEENDSISLNCLKLVIKELLQSLQNMQTYSSARRIKKGNIGRKKD